MFGYIVPMECELKVRELSLYKAYYCGLCRNIAARYGQAARLSLHYDCAFLALLLSAASGDAQPASACRCFYKPLRGKQPSAPPSPALDYAADVNVLLAWHKLRDDRRDEHSAKAFFGMPLLYASFRRAEKNRPALSQSIEAGLAALTELERGALDASDAPACAFGAVMRDILRLAPGLSDANRAAGEWMFFNLGRYAYLADAWEDRASDAKARAFNPFNRLQTSREEASFLIHVSLSEAEKAYDLMSFAGETGILDNILRLGCRHRAEKLLHGADEQKGMERTHESV